MTIAFFMLAQTSVAFFAPASSGATFRASRPRQPSSALSLLGLPDVPVDPKDADLVAGFIIVACAKTPYILEPLDPFKILTNKFVDTFTNDEEGKKAEIGYKTRLAALGVAITALAFYEVYFVEETNAATILRDSYVIWALYYTECTRVLRDLATRQPPVYASDNRSFSQALHLIVSLVLWLDVSDLYSGHAITNAIKELFKLSEYGGGGGGGV
eukprot:CAMPEP_0172320032 /NCGR_PEP_ID=MMETSP1058-20130122/39431_1 /TAXON_ID=83371 /ORGANISM="Detonula confervacea, Strain CCMP 353" /LENGTH=213 /DNA_ID=CAMNT_0013035209 /DNA_START=33 /DNA_END=674 /DNA_ORIENTATION=+